MSTVVRTGTQAVGEDTAATHASAGTMTEGVCLATLSMEGEGYVTAPPFVSSLTTIN